MSLGLALWPGKLTVSIAVQRIWSPIASSQTERVFISVPYAAGWPSTRDWMELIDGGVHVKFADNEIVRERVAGSDTLPARYVKALMLTQAAMAALSGSVRVNNDLDALEKLTWEMYLRFLRRVTGGSASS